VLVTGISTDVCLAFPRLRRWPTVIRPLPVIDSSGSFTQRQGELGVMRMVQAGVIPVAYSNAAIEILGDNAAPEAEAVYGALNMPFASLVLGLGQYFSKQH